MRLLCMVLLLAAASGVSTPAAAQAPRSESAWRDVPRLDPRLSYVIVEARDPGSFVARTGGVAVAAQPEPRRHGTGRLVMGGVLGGGLGLVGGWVAGALLQGERETDCIDMCFGMGPVVGVLAGEAFGIALGVHLANGGRGHAGLGMLTSTAILAGGVLMLSESASGGVVLAIPVGQIIGTITTERTTEHARMRRRPAP